MATILTMDQAIQQVPANTPKVVAIGDVITSDRFNRAGALGDSTTDLFLGGTAKVWSGMHQAANVTRATAGGQLSLAAAGVFSTCVDAGRPDATISMKMVSFSTLMQGGQNSMIEFRKAQANTGDTYRITVGPYFTSMTSASLLLAKRVAGSATTVANLPNIKPGQVLKIDIKGNRIRIYYDEILQADVTDNSITAGNFFGFAGSSNNREWVITDYVVRSN